MDVKDYFGLRIRGNFAKYRSTVEEHRFAYLLVVPTVLFMVVLIWFQFLYGIWVSFHEFSFISPQPQWVGLANYELLLSWEAMRVSIRASAIFALMTTVIHIVLGMVAALAVNRLTKFENAFSGVFLLGYTMAPVVTGTLWVYLLQPRLGPFFGYLVELGVLSEPIFWGSDPTAAMAVIIGVAGWTFWPFAFIVFLANLQTIPDQHYEAAKIYGASRLQTFWKVTLPQLKSAFLMVVAIRLIWNVSKIGQPLQITDGGPGYSTSVLGILLYDLARTQGRLGRGYAVGVVMFIITLLFVVLFLREYRRSTGEVQA
jgi:ABC-type sugar transport system permease subunit